jgi:hypothetical protein
MRLDAGMFFCRSAAVVGLSCRIQAGSDCSSIKELAEMLRFDIEPSSVLGAENEDGRNVSCGCGGRVPLTSAAGRIHQPGIVLSPTF